MQHNTRSFCKWFSNSCQQNNTRSTWIHTKSIVEMSALFLWELGLAVLLAEGVAGNLLHATSCQLFLHDLAVFSFSNCFFLQSKISPFLSPPLCHRRESMPFCHYSSYSELYDIIALPLSLLLWKISSLSKKIEKYCSLSPPTSCLNEITLQHYSSHQLIMSLVLSPKNA